jgi:L-rhamnonate dehydratase
MDNPRITAIEWGVLEGRRPRSAGRNSRLPEHGPTMRDPIVRVTLEDGSTGFGWSRATQERAEALLGAHLNDLISAETGVTAQGQPIEFALWDLFGHRENRPVYVLAARHYGVTIPQPQRAPCYDTTLYFDDLHLDSHDEAATLIAEEAQQGWARGHRAFKLKVGRGALHMPLEAGTERDIAVIRAVRQAIGPDAPLMIDANNGWNVNLVKRVLTETADCHLYWLEEPFHEDQVLYDHLQNWMRSQRLDVLIADGEGLASPRLMQWAQAGTIEVVQYDLRDIGLTNWLKTGKQLDSWNVKSAPHNYGSNFGNYASCHLAGVIANFTFVEWDHAETPGLDTSAYSLSEGYIHIPDAPGFGLKLEDAIFQNAVQNGGYSLRA